MNTSLIEKFQKIIFMNNKLTTLPKKKKKKKKKKEGRKYLS